MTSFSYKLFLPEVKRAVDSANIRVLKRQGAYLRGVAKRSIRYKKNSAINSAPGSAPYTHGRKVLKNAIMFAYDAASMTVVIGPSNNKVGDIAATHEHGGTEQHKKKTGAGITPRVIQPDRTWVQLLKRSKTSFRNSGITPLNDNHIWIGELP